MLYYAPNNDIREAPMEENTSANCDTMSPRLSVFLSESEIVENTKGFAFQTKRIIMAPNTYPKNWRSRTIVNK